jgi:hypothetical protein
MIWKGGREEGGGKREKKRGKRGDVEWMRRKKRERK